MILYAGISDVGYNREINEDFIHIKEIDSEKGIFFAIIADGAGTISNKFQAASIASLQIESVIERLCTSSPDILYEYPEAVLSEAFHSAGRTLGLFRVIDEEKYSGFAASVTCVFIVGNKLTVAHTGNTRANLFRYKNGKYNCLQLTKDQTKGMELVDEGKMSFNDYHLSAERLIITGGLGLSAEPNIQTSSVTLKPNDFILLTTDGIHNAIRPDVFFEIIKRSVNCDETVKTFVEAAKLEKYEDNMAAIMLWNTEE